MFRQENQLVCGQDVFPKNFLQIFRDRYFVIGAMFPRDFKASFGGGSEQFGRRGPVQGLVYIFLGCEFLLIELEAQPVVK